MEFDSEPGYGDSDKYIKTKIKIYAGVMIANFRTKKKLNEKARYKCVLIMILDSAIKAKKKYYAPTILEE